MTSTPVKDVSFGTGGLTPVNTKGVSNGGFQAVWNSQTEKQTEQGTEEENGQSVKKTPGDSWKARDEHRARTEKREPSRNVEERADIPDEKLEEAAELLGAAAMELIEQVADTIGVSPEEVLGAMEQLGMEQLEVLTPQNLGGLILTVAGAEDASALVMDEALYGSYQEVMTKLEGVLRESAETLEQSPELLIQMLEQSLPEEPVTEEFIREAIPETISETGSEAVSEAVSEVISTETSPAVSVSAEAAETEVTESLPEVKAESKEDNTELTETAAQSGATKSAEAGLRTENADSSREDRQEGGREQQETNLFAQNLKTEHFEAQVQQTAAPESVWDADTENIMRQILDYMKINVKSDVSSMEMQLHPANLGTLQIHVTSRGGVVTANFITQNETVKTMLESQMIQLKAQFEEQGVKVEAIEVTVQTHEFERNLDQGRGGNNSQGQEPSRKGRIRRINLNDSVVSEETEEEDVLTKDIMETNGNTVDYSV